MEAILKNKMLNGLLLLINYVINELKDQLLIFREIAFLLWYPSILRKHPVELTLTGCHMLLL